jgi:hypothetical protein
MPIIGSLAGASAKGLGGLGASLILVPTTLTVDYLSCCWWCWWWR